MRVSTVTDARPGPAVATGFVALAGPDLMAGTLVMRRRHRRNHLRFWGALAVLLPLLLLAAIGSRQTIPASVTPIRLAPP